jgi:hypothetical protein
MLGEPCELLRGCTTLDPSGPLAQARRIRQSVVSRSAVAKLMGHARRETTSPCTGCRKRNESDTQQLDTRLYFHPAQGSTFNFSQTLPPTRVPTTAVLVRRLQTGHRRALTPKRRLQLVEYIRRIHQRKMTTDWLPNARGQHEYAALPGRRGWSMIIECWLRLPKAWVITATAKS